VNWAVVPPGPRSQLLQLGDDLGVERAKVFRTRLAEKDLVNLVEPAELIDGCGMIVDAEVHQPIIEPGIPAAGRHDQQGRRLLAAPVTARPLPRLERDEQPLGKWSGGTT